MPNQYSILFCTYLRLCFSVLKKIKAKQINKINETKHERTKFRSLDNGSELF